MEITGKIAQILPEQTGEGKNGPWRKQDVILVTESQYPKSVCMTIWGDKIDQFALQPEDRVTASIDIESREYNGRWYTDVKPWKVEKATGSSQSEPSQEPADYNDQPSDQPDDDLPF